MTLEQAMDFVTIGVFAMLSIGIGFAFLRLIIGPTLPDRVVALDLIAMLAAGGIAVYAIRADEPVYLLTAIVLALVMFVATVAFAMFVEKGMSD